MLNLDPNVQPRAHAEPVEDGKIMPEEPKQTALPPHEEHDNFFEEIEEHFHS